MIIIVMRENAKQTEIDGVMNAAKEMGLEPSLSSDSGYSIVSIRGESGDDELGNLRGFPGVRNIVSVASPWKSAGREMHPADSVISFGDVKIGGKGVVVMAGPCAVEKKEWLMETAKAVKAAGARFLRGGAFKPRTSPYAFRGLGEEGLKMLSEAREKTGLFVVTEAMSSSGVPLVARYADILQIGARNMQNFALLEAAADSGLPILLKRGMMSTIDELLTSADYILSRGNDRVITCERGIRSFEHHTRNTLDISAVAAVKSLSHLPVIVDPSHAAGNRDYVIPLARAAVAAGADGIIVEVHPHPEKAYCDGRQSLGLDQFVKMMEELRAVAKAVGREII